MIWYDATSNDSTSGYVPAWGWQEDPWSFLPVVAVDARAPGWLWVYGGQRRTGGRSADVLNGDAPGQPGAYHEPRARGPPA